MVLFICKAGIWFIMKFWNFSQISIMYLGFFFFYKSTSLDFPSNFSTFPWINRFGVLQSSPHPAHTTSNWYKSHKILDRVAKEGCQWCLAEWCDAKKRIAWLHWQVDWLTQQVSALLLQSRLSQNQHDDSDLDKNLFAAIEDYSLNDIVGLKFYSYLKDDLDGLINWQSWKSYNIKKKNQYWQSLAKIMFSKILFIQNLQIKNRAMRVTGISCLWQYLKKFINCLNYTKMAYLSQESNDSMISLINENHQRSVYIWRTKIK